MMIPYPPSQLPILLSNALTSSPRSPQLQISKKNTANNNTANNNNNGIMKKATSTISLLLLLYILPFSLMVEGTSTRHPFMINNNNRFQQQHRFRYRQHVKTKRLQQQQQQQDYNQSPLLQSIDLQRGGGGSSTKTITTSKANNENTPKVIRTISESKMKAFNLLSGGVAGTVASCLTNPLEVVKTQLQSSSMSITTTTTSTSTSLSRPFTKALTVARNVLNNDGPTGFLRGLKPTLIGIIPARSIYFYAYEKSRIVLGGIRRHSGGGDTTEHEKWRDGQGGNGPSKPLFPEGGTINALLSGFTAGFASNTLTNPIWMVKTRMQLLSDTNVGQKAYTGYRDAIRTIYQEEGLGGFYRGIYASYWGCIEGALQFVLYEKMKSAMMTRAIIAASLENQDEKDNIELPKYVYFWSAAAAKAVASIATYPHEVARTRLREQARMGIFKYSGMWGAIGVIAKEEGRGGLYAGMGVHLMKVVPNSAIMFLTYEVVKSYLSQYTIVTAKDTK